MLLALFGATWIVAGWALWRRRRFGVHLALLAIVILLAKMPLTGTRALRETLLLVVATVAVLSAWRETRP